jgi:hypothetical protein
MFLLPKSTPQQTIVPSKFLVYSTFEKVVGLVKLPLDGNPTKTMALIAHPGPISCIASSFDGKYIITAGGGDRSVNLWQVNPASLNEQVQTSGIDPYMSLIEGGRNGEFYQDILDYFYYGQLRSQGINTTEARKTTGFVPVEEVINLMRALGYYPTEQEILDMKNEIKFSHLNQSGKYKDMVDLEEFMRCKQQSQQSLHLPVPSSILLFEFLSARCSARDRQFLHFYI